MPHSWYCHIARQCYNNSKRMSLVQIAYQSLLSKLREWPRLQQKERLEVLQQANSLMGPSFRKALGMLE